MEAPNVPALPIMCVLLLSRVSSGFVLSFYLFILTRMSASRLYTLVCPPGAKAIVTCLSWYSALYVLLMYVVRAGSCSLEFPFSGLTQLIQETGNCPPPWNSSMRILMLLVGKTFLPGLFISFSSLLDFAAVLWCLGGFTCQISYFSGRVQMVLKGIYEMPFPCGTHSNRIKVNSS